MLTAYSKDLSTYKKLRPLLKDILMLYDAIALEARDLYNDGGNRQGGRLSFVEGPKPGKPFSFPFTGQQGEYRLFRGALLPMVGAFLWLVVEDEVTGEYKWRDDFETVLALWRQTGQELMDATQSVSLDLGRKLTALGKSPNLWARLHGTVTNRYLLKYSNIAK